MFVVHFSFKQFYIHCKTSLAAFDIILINDTPMVVVKNGDVSIVIDFVTDKIDSVLCKLLPRGSRRCELSIIAL